MTKKDSKPKNKLKRELLDVRVDEISLVDSPAIEEEFVVMKNQSFGEKLGDARMEAGLSVDDLAEATGLEPAEINALEKDERGPTDEEFVAIAKRLEAFESRPSAEEENDEPAQPEIEKPEPEAGATTEGENVEKQADPKDEVREKQDEKYPKPNYGYRFTKPRLDKLTAALKSLLSVLADVGLDMSELTKVAKSAETEEAETPSVESEETIVETDYVEKADLDKSHEKIDELTKRLAEMETKIAQFESAGVSKSLGNDDNKSEEKTSIWAGLF